MSAAPTAERISRDESIGSIALWFAVFTPPIAWALQIFGITTLEDVIACTPGSRFAGTIFGLPLASAVLAVSAFTFALTIAAGVVAVHCWRVNRSSADGRPAWMALLAAVESALFAIMIGSGFAPAILLHPCGPVR